MDKHSTAFIGKLFQTLLVLTVKKLAQQKSLSMWFVNLITVPSCTCD